MAYYYEPLPDAKSIRLLHIAPGYGNNPLEAHLTAYRLEDRCEYEAVSYVWGDPDSNGTLHVDDRNLKISRNLQTILLQLRLSEGTRTLWIDAICINQEDISEKSNQVALMGQVYQQAETVICWLGQLTTHRLWALKYFQNLADDSATYIKPDNLEYQWTLDLCDDKLLPGVDADKIIVEAQEAHVETIYGSDWFTRLWVVQEVAIARKPSIQCGSFELSWNDFELATRIMACCCRQSTKVWEELMAINDTWDLLVLRGTYKLNTRPIHRAPIVFHIDQKWSVGRIVWSMKSKRCKDDRDRIYALLSLTASGNSLQLLPEISITPDYSKPVGWVYHQFWKHFGGCTSLFWAGLSRRPASERTKDITGFFDTASKTMSHDFLPSWVPDLRPHSGESWSPIFEQFYSTSTPFHHLQCNVSKTGPGMLVIRGHRFDVVERVLAHQKARSFVNTRKTVNYLLSLESEFGPYPSGQNWVEALGSTLITDELTDHEHPFQKQLNKTGCKTGLTNNEIQRLWKLYREFLLADTGEIWKKVCALAKSPVQVLFDPAVELSQEGQAIWTLHSFLSQVFQNHCLIITKQGYMGLAPPDTLVGDVVVAYGGPSVPFVVRDTSLAAFSELVILGPRGHVFASDVGTPVSELLGPCYLQGIMKGELINEEKWKKELKWEIDELGTTPKPTLCLI